MRVHGESADRSLNGIVESKVVEKQEGIEFIADARRDGAPQQHARALDDVLRFDNLGDGSKAGHADMMGRKVVVLPGFLSGRLYQPVARAMISSTPRPKMCGGL